MKIVMFGNSSGARQWRLEDPAKYMAKHGFEIRFPDEMTPEALDWADVIVVQGLVDKNLIAAIYAFQQEYGKKVVVEFDDYLEVAKDSPHKLDHEVKEAPMLLRTQMKFADMVTTTTPYLANKFKKLNKNVRVLPNLMDMDRWDLPTEQNQSDEIRIGWAGSMTHLKDFNTAKWALKKIMKEFPNVKLVLMGDPRIADGFNNVEALMGVPMEFYPKRLHGLRLDIGIAPLRNNLFNRCKSNIKPLEYGICGVPCIASDVEPYKSLDGVVLLAKDKYEWYNNLKNLIADKQYREELGRWAYVHVKEHYDLSKNIDLFVEAYDSLM